MQTLAPAAVPLTWRPLAADVVPPWHRLVEAAASADDAVEHYTPDDLHDELAPWVDLAEDTTIGVDAEGVARAFGLVQVRPGDVTELRITCWGAVDPAARGQGIGRALLAWQLERAGALAARRRRELEAEVPAFAIVDVDVEHVPAAARLAERAGLRPARWFSTLRRNLAQPVPSPVVPPGLVLTGYEPALDEAVRRAHNEAFADHWGFQPWTEEAWAHWSTGHRSFRADWSFAVLDGGEVAAYVLSAAYPSDWPAQGYRDGYTAKLGVRRPWRGRGLARALLARSLEVFEADGMEYATLDVDSDNPTGAVQLYTSLGYELHRRSASYRLPL